MEVIVAIATQDRISLRLLEGQCQEEDNGYECCAIVTRQNCWHCQN